MQLVLQKSVEYKDVEINITSHILFIYVMTYKQRLLFCSHLLHTNAHV